MRYALPAAMLLSACAAGDGVVVHVAVDTTTRFQTMSGWEATAQAGQDGPHYPRYRDTLLTLATRDLGLNRLRLEVRSGVEHRRDYWREGREGRLTGDAYRCARYETLNDNTDPRVIEWAGFQFSELDHTVEQLVLPFQRMLAERGDRMVLNLTYVSFFRQCPQASRYAHRSADEYAEFILATTLHLRERYGLVPDLWEVILEPDNTDDWSSTAIGRAIVATAARLRENGFTPAFVAPSNTAAEAAVRYYDGLRTVPGAGAEVAELGYHRYRWVTRGTLLDIAERGRRDGVHTAMLEHISSGVDDLIDDLTIANVSAWSQYALAYVGGEDDGGLYYRIDDTNAQAPIVREGSRTRFLRQIFRAARIGAVRVSAASDVSSARPVAFAHDGRAGAAIRTTGAARLVVTGLPPGRYELTYATDAEAHGTLPDQVIAAGDSAIGTIPAAGVLTMVAR